MVINLRSRLRVIRRTGFTLIEVMTAVAITGIIGVALTTSIFQVMTVQSATKNRTDAVKQVENALHYVNQDAQMGAPRQTATNNTGNHFYLTSLTSAVSIGNTSLTVVDSTGFVAPGSVVVGTGNDAEVINYSAKNGNVLTISP